MLPSSNKINPVDSIKINEGVTGGTGVRVLGSVIPANFNIPLKGQMLKASVIPLILVMLIHHPAASGDAPEPFAPPLFAMLPATIWDNNWACSGGMSGEDDPGAI